MRPEHPIINRHPELKELVGIIRHEIQQAQRPAEEIVLTDEDVMKILKISKRTLDDFKKNQVLPRHQPIPRSKCFYLLSDILNWLKKKSDRVYRK